MSGSMHSICGIFCCSRANGVALLSSRHGSVASTNSCWVSLLTHNFSLCSLGEGGPLQRLPESSYTTYSDGNFARVATMKHTLLASWVECTLLTVVFTAYHIDRLAILDEFSRYNCFTLQLDYTNKRFSTLCIRVSVIKHLRHDPRSSSSSPCKGQLALGAGYEVTLIDGGVAIDLTRTYEAVLPSGS